MICQVLYNIGGIKTLYVKGFSDVEKAKKWMDNEGEKSNIQSARIMVGYEAVETLTEMCDLMKEKLFGTSEKTII